MSRCFPFPPPGYVTNGLKGYELLNQMEIHKEKELLEKNEKEKKKRKDRCNKDHEKRKDRCNKDNEKRKDRCNKDHEKRKDRCNKDNEKRKDRCNKDHEEYKKLFANWAPPPLEMVLIDCEEDEEWWLPNNKDVMPKREKRTQTEDVLAKNEYEGSFVDTIATKRRSHWWRSVKRPRAPSNASRGQKEVELLLADSEMVLGVVLHRGISREVEDALQVAVVPAEDLEGEAAAREVVEDARVVAGDGRATGEVCEVNVDFRRA
ncbi:hypothetical protein RIF29_13129 [Crotalaria pallida]|uniref:Uncharacterized protein n=1 Tax=Crotalaria pallida TaxID=3830 RepID=A0AAN9P1N4_CROPI